eukprot:PhM_4_TR449/c0_g1_i1/m.84022
MCPSATTHCRNCGYVKDTFRSVTSVSCRATSSLPALPRSVFMSVSRCFWRSRMNCVSASSSSPEATDIGRTVSSSSGVGVAKKGSEYTCRGMTLQSTSISSTSDSIWRMAASMHLTLSGKTRTSCNMRTRSGRAMTSPSPHMEYDRMKSCSIVLYDSSSPLMSPKRMSTRGGRFNRTSSTRSYASMPGRTVRTSSHRTPRSRLARRVSPASMRSRRSAQNKGAASSDSFCITATCFAVIAPPIPERTSSWDRPTRRVLPTRSSATGEASAATASTLVVLKSAVAAISAPIVLSMLAVDDDAVDPAVVGRCCELALVGDVPGALGPRLCPLRDLRERFSDSGTV